MSSFEYNDGDQFSFTSDIVSRKNQDGTLLIMRMDDSDIFYKVDGLAAQTTNLLHEGNSPKESIQKLSTNFPNIPLEQIKTDVSKLVSELAMKGILKKISWEAPTTDSC